MFEQRILCHKLPKSFDPIRTDIEQDHCANKRNKIIQELKRRMLNKELEKYEQKIQHYEHLYQQELATLHEQILNPPSSKQKWQVETLMYFVKQYFSHHTDRFLRQIRYRESCRHAKLLRHYRRHSALSHKTVDVYPQTIIDVSNIGLNRTQLNYLSHNGEFEILFNSYLD
jgi:DNA gyrase/topoisomerase IV subunit B